MICIILIFASLINASDYDRIDVTALAQGKPFLFYSSKDTLIINDSIPMVKIGTKQIEHGDGLFQYGIYKIGDKKYDEYIFTGYENKNIRATGVIKNGNRTETFETLKLKIKDIKDVYQVSSGKNAEGKEYLLNNENEFEDYPPNNRFTSKEKWEVTGILIGGGAIIGGLIGGVYTAKHNEGYPGQEIAGIVMGATAGIFIGGFYSL